MKLNVTAAWLASFEPDEPRGFATAQDRDMQEQHRIEASLADSQNRHAETEAQRLAERENSDLALPGANLNR